MRYLIHTCNQREWYVRDYLVPSMIEQGIDENDITVWLDSKCEGNLKAFINSCRELPEDGGTWHMQDDVVICKDFKERTEKYDNGMIAGFTCYYDVMGEAGYVSTKDMWYSFPCIRIPNKLIHEFIKWVDKWVWNDPQYERHVKKSKGDDWIFKVYIENYCSDVTALNLAPNLVDHIDYLIGGTIINPDRRKKNVRSIYWEDESIVKELEQELKRRK